MGVPASSPSHRQFLAGYPFLHPPLFPFRGPELLLQGRRLDVVAQTIRSFICH